MKTCAKTVPTLESLPEYFRVKDIDGLFPVHLSTLYRMVERKELPAMRFGKKIVIEKASMLRWMAQRNGRNLMPAQ